MSTDFSFFTLDFRQYKVIAFYFLFAFLFTLSSSQVCKYIDPCKCSFHNGSIIDLTTLGDRNGVRWPNMKPTRKNDSYHYYYNPCYNFKLGPENSACSHGVAVCQVENNTKYYNCGQQQHAFFIWNSDKNALNLVYESSPRTTNVTLVCSPDAVEPKLEVKGEVRPELYEMTLITKCACPDMCNSDHLSPGSVLVIIFFIFVSLYLLLGIIHSSLTRGAHGIELIPHYEFWSDFPLLVRDGCVFVMSGCKPETAYERI